MTGTLSNWTREEYESNHDRVRSTSMKSMMSDQGPRSYYLNHVVAAGGESLPSIPGLVQPKINELILGILFHEFLFEKQQNWFHSSVRFGTKAWKDDIEENDGRWAIKPAQHDMLMGMYEAVQRNSRAVELITDNGFAEQTFLFEKNGILAKARVDLFGHDATIVDLKTSQHASRYGFDNQIREFKYEFSASFYEQARNSVPEFEGTRADFVHIVVSKKPPHYCYVWPLDDSYLRVGHRDVDTAFERLAQCLGDQERIESEQGNVIDAWPDLQERSQDNRLSAPVHYLSSSGFHPDQW